MKANELMIGDWVLYTGDGEPVVKYVAELTSLNQVYLYNHKLDPGSWIIVGAKYVSPIPLTQEILEKNGFVYSDLPFEQSWQQYGLSIYGTTGNYHINCGMNVSMDVSNVHQLQHVFRLCGIEKEIEL